MFTHQLNLFKHYYLRTSMLQLKDFKLRGYQESIVKTAILKNTLVVLPTGLGKTAISIALSLERLEKFPDSKIVLTAPTKPLCQQHYDTFINNTNLNEEDITLLTGSIAPNKRAQIFQDSRVILQHLKLYNLISSQKDGI